MSVNGALPNVRVTLVGPVYTINPIGKRSALWTTKYWTPSHWEFVDCDTARQGTRSCLSLLQRLVREDVALVMRGQIAAVTEILLRFYSIIESSSCAASKRKELFSHCLIVLRHGKAVEIGGIEAVIPVLSGLKPLIESSYDVPTYAPAHIVWSLYTTAFEQREMPPSRWIRQRFGHESIDYPEPVLGLNLCILPYVFIPDPGVLDLFLSAYLSPDGVLRRDMRDSALSEPCTGSGILAMAAVMLGARHVVSSDIDQSSAECAQQNVERLGFGRQISVKLMDGIPEQGSYDVLLTNPPWYEQVEERSSPYRRRCLEDPGRKILWKILSQAAQRRARVAYVFFGNDDPFPADRLAIEEWTTERRWGGSQGVRLQRLVRKA